MEKRCLMQFEFQAKNGDLYWFPLFLNETDPKKITAIEMALVRLLNRNYKKVCRYEQHPVRLPLEEAGIIREYIREERKGEWMLFIPALKHKKIEDLPRETAFHFKKESSIREFEGKDLYQSVVVEGIPKNTCLLRSIEDMEQFNSMEFLILRLKEKVPAYIRPKRLAVFNRMIGFLTGLIITMSLVLMAFSWKTPLKDQLNNDPIVWEDIPEESFPVQIRPETPPPPPPPPAPVDLVKPVDEVTITVAPDPLPPIPDEKMSGAEVDIDMPFLADEKLIEDPIYIRVEEMPAFPGCEHIPDPSERKICTDRKIYEMLKKTQHYPQDAIELHAEGTVYVSFVIEKNGKVDQVEVLKGVRGAPMLDEEAVRVIKTLPRFTPGIQQGRNVRVKFHIPIRFSLK